MWWYVYVRDLFRDLNLFWKFTLAIFLISGLGLLGVSLFGYYQGKQLLVEKSFEILDNITEKKKNRIEEHFENNEHLLRSLSNNPGTLLAFQQFSQTFGSIQNIQDQDSLLPLRKFYDLEFTQTLKYRLVDKDPDADYFPQHPKTQSLQHRYLAINPKPYLFKDQFIRFDDPDPYDRVHQQYHPFFQNFSKQFKLKDIYLVDNSGWVLYSVGKKIDFGTNLIQGPLRSSSLALLFKKIINLKDKQAVLFQDYSYYEPEYFAPTGFMATPLLLGNGSNQQIIGVLIFQLEPDIISDILSNKQDWQAEGLGTTGETALIGPDYLIRNNTRLFLEDPYQYQQDLLKKGEDSLTVEKIKRLETTILLRRVGSQAAIDALNGKEGKKANTDFLGNQVFDVFKPIQIPGSQWAILTEMTAPEIFQSIADFRWNLLIFTGGILLIIFVLGILLANSLSKPLRKIQKEISMLAEGRFPNPSKRIYKDELGKIDQSLNQLINNMKDVAVFAEEIGKGNFEHKFSLKHQNDVLAASLLQMRENLIKVSETEQERNWINTGTSLFGEILRNNSTDVDPLAHNTISELVKYVGAHQGIFFYYEESEAQLRALSSYAYGKHKYIDQAIAPGESLVGQAFLEKGTIYLTEIPENYTVIGSGLGQAVPDSILLVPLRLNEEVFGVIELASLELLKPYEIDFVEIISEDIATTISAIKSNQETRKLLQESQRVTEQLRSQEEEMRKNFEALMISQDELRLRQEQIDNILQNGPPEGQDDDISDESRLETPVQLDIQSANLKERVQKAINRQKELLNKALKRNQSQENLLKSHVKNLQNGDDEATAPEN